MYKGHLSIGETANILGVSIQTLRRWDEDKFFVSERQRKGNHRMYDISVLDAVAQQEKFNLMKMARSWATRGSHWHPFDSVYCATKDVFQVRLQALERDLATQVAVADVFSLVSSCIGELGNNSFDHNLGNWPDTPGIFFGYSIRKRYIVLADRGQGILTTLQRVRPSLKHHHEALRVAFTEVVTGRSPEHRGNGLKYVRKIVTQNDFSLQFQTGNALLSLKKGERGLAIKTVQPSIIGCLIIFYF